MPTVELSSELVRLGVAFEEDVDTSLALKVDKDGSKVLSDNNYTTAEKTLVANAVQPAALASGLSDKVDTATYTAGLATKANSSDVTTALAGKADNSSLTSGLAGKVDKDGAKVLSTNDYTTAEKTKLSGIATAATANSTDAVLLARANHTGTQATSTVTGLDAALAAARVTSILIAASDETTALTAGNGKVTFRMPFAMTGVTVRASLTTAQTSGNIFTVDVNEGGVSILSTKLTIDNTEKSSFTAAIPPVVSDASLADDAEITIDIDQIGDGTAKGLKVYITGTV